MASYSLIWRRSAEKELRALPKDAIARLVALAESLRENPFPQGTRKLVNSEHAYRLRSGDYRIVYTVEGNRLTVEVVRVAHRKEAYR
ncbi:MAG TPA: type II toxin-antitoxin system RelE/ParE family toxin [bacterium]|jgi:mRNA interferase RelE/StbE